MSFPSLFPRGNSLTESMPFADREGVTWLAYIEGVAPPDHHHAVNGRLPGRRLRFDSEDESRATTELPAGAPFLSDERLQALLDRAQPVTAPTTGSWQLPEPPIKLQRAIEWTAHAGRAGAALLVELVRRWREGADRRRELREQAADLMSAAYERARQLAAQVRQEIEEQHGSSPPPPAEPTVPRSVIGRRWRGARSAGRLGPR
jgi:hypothetical protein